MTRKKILLVDDSSTVILMEKMILRNEPVDVVVARDGREAVAKALVEKPDLILMDLVMPNMSGVEAIRELRIAEATRETPIIMVTTHAEAESVESGYQAGTTEYVTKPINNIELLVKIRHLLGEAA